MRTVEYRSRTRFSILIGLSCFLVLGFVAQSTINRQEDLTHLRSRLIADLRVEDLRIRNETRAFDVIGVEKTPEGYIKITLRNNYSKTIVAYQTSMGSTTTLVDSFTNAIKMGIEPGEVRERIEAIDVDPELLPRGFVVLAVVFDDATADGDPQFIQQIHDFRLGEMLQTEGFLSSLSDLRGASEAEVPSLLQGAVSNMLNLETNSRMSADVISGLRNMRLVFTREIDTVRSAQKDDRTRVVNALVNHYQSKLAEIRVYNEKAREHQILRDR